MKFKLEYEHKVIAGITVKAYYISKKFLWWYLPMVVYGDMTLAGVRHDIPRYNVSNIPDCLDFVQTGVIHWRSPTSRPMWYYITKDQYPEVINTFYFDTEEELKKEFAEELI